MDSSQHDEIALRAYRLFEAAGRPEGRSLDFWLAAEQERHGTNLADRYTFGKAPPETRAEAPDYLRPNKPAEGGDDEGSDTVAL
ncbi:MAG: DUF2934 domain-containing protein [Verrucomicrobia bacterium]|nr:DUF2934 domain-containing protein [Verrucomicrobiota bacterium]